MSLFGGQQRSVYRVYAEEEYDADAESFTAEAEMESGDSDDQAEPADFDSHSTGIGPGSRQPARIASGFEPRLRPVALGVVGLIVAVAAIAVVLVLSSTAHRSPRGSLPASAQAVTSAHRRSPSTLPTSARPRSAHQSNRLGPRRPSAPARTGRGGGAHASVAVPVPIAPGQPPRSVSPPSISAEFGFER